VFQIKAELNEAGQYQLRTTADSPDDWMEWRYPEELELVRKADPFAAFFIAYINSREDAITAANQILEKLGSSCRVNILGRVVFARR
jgi:hypothetical protein